MIKLFSVSLLATAMAFPAMGAESHDRFYSKLSALCGKSFEGRVMDSNASDTVWCESRIVIRVAECGPERIFIPIAVGDNHSRHWVISKTDNGLRLKHDHRHHDGTQERVSMYGGDTLDDGSDEQQFFPADDYSKHVFQQNGLLASIENVWSFAIRNGVLSYRLERPNRRFQVDFDLTKPLP